MILVGALLGIAVVCNYVYVITNYLLKDGAE